MTEHTKGLLRVGHSGAVVADHPVPEISGSDAVEYYGGHLVAESVTAANARRLAACWNACDGFTTEELEAHTGPRLLRARLEGAFARIDELLSERNRVGIDISSAILSGIVPDRHPLRSRLELLANHHKRELELAEQLKDATRQIAALADPLRDANQYIEESIPSCISEYHRGCDLTDRINAALSGSAQTTPKPGCGCRTCHPLTINDMRFVICPDCGNKRCPRASDHRNACTGSNEAGQAGSSAFAAAPTQPGGEPCASEPPSSSPD